MAHAMHMATGAGGGDSADGDAHKLADGLWLVRSELTRSKLYHRIKWQLPEGTALLCTPLGDEPDGWPKFKGLSSGAGKWLKGEG